MPGYSTFRRLFVEVIGEEDFEQRMRANTAYQREGMTDSRVRAMDGKVERGMIPPGETQGEVTMTVYDPQRQEVIAQVAIDPQAGEIPTAQQLLAQGALNGKIFLADALNTQRKLCRQISKAGGAYLLTVKENQPKLYQDIARLFTLPQPQAKPTCWTTKRSTRPTKAMAAWKNAR